MITIKENGIVSLKTFFRSVASMLLSLIRRKSEKIGLRLILLLFIGKL